MMPKKPSTFVRIVTAGLVRLAEVERVPEDRRQAYIDNAVACLAGVFSQQYGGNRIWMSAPRMPDHERQARRRRIVEAIASGEALQTIAQRERVSLGHLRKIRARRCVT